MLKLYLFPGYCSIFFHIMDDPLLVPGVGSSSNANNFLFLCLIIKPNTGSKRGKYEDFKSVLFSAIS
jgi:hypothetical protein